MAIALVSGPLLCDVTKTAQAVYNTAMSQFNEQMADKEVIKNLMRHIARITKGKGMTFVLVKNENGEVARALNFETISREYLTNTAEKLEKELAEVKEAIALYDQLTTPDVEITAPEPVTEAPVETVTPEQTPEVAPVTDTTPEAQPVQEEQPTAQPIPEPIPVIQ